MYDGHIQLDNPTEPANLAGPHSWISQREYKMIDVIVMMQNSMQSTTAASSVPTRYHGAQVYPEQ